MPELEIPHHNVVLLRGTSRYNGLLLEGPKAVSPPLRWSKWRGICFGFKTRFWCQRPDSKYFSLEVRARRSLATAQFNYLIRKAGKHSQGCAVSCVNGTAYTWAGWVPRPCFPSLLYRHLRHTVLCPSTQSIACSASCGAGSCSPVFNTVFIILWEFHTEYFDHIYPQALPDPSSCLLPPLHFFLSFFSFPPLFPPPPSLEDTILKLTTWSPGSYNLFNPSFTVFLEP